MRYGFRGVVADPEENEMEDLTELGKDDFEEELGGKFVWKKRVTCGFKDHTCIYFICHRGSPGPI